MSVPLFGVFVLALFFSCVDLCTCSCLCVRWGWKGQEKRECLLFQTLPPSRAACHISCRTTRPPPSLQPMAGSTLQTPDCCPAWKNTQIKNLNSSDFSKKAKKHLVLKQNASLRPQFTSIYSSLFFSCLSFPVHFVCTVKE